MRRAATRAPTVRRNRPVCHPPQTCSRGIRRSPEWRRREFGCRYHDLLPTPEPGWRLPSKRVSRMREQQPRHPRRYAETAWCGRSYSAHPHGRRRMVARYRRRKSFCPPAARRVPRSPASSTVRESSLGGIPTPLSYRPIPVSVSRGKSSRRNKPVYRCATRATWPSAPADRPAASRRPRTQSPSRHCDSA